MNRFFGPSTEQPFKIPGRLYARLIDFEPYIYALFDCVDADFFDNAVRESGGNMDERIWSEAVERAPIFAIEVNTGLITSPDFAAQDWLKKRGDLDTQKWHEISSKADDKGPADIFNNISGPAQRASIRFRDLNPKTISALNKAVDLNPYINSNKDIECALPSSVIEQVFVLDVGQGAANALVNPAGNVVAYVDVGAGILKNSNTWPTSLMEFCFAYKPTIILTHWHYDHFKAANINPSNKTPWAREMTWIAPYQVLGAGPQSAMATAIKNAGILRIWNAAAGTTLRNGAIEIERCSGTGSQNRDGIAVWVHGPDESDDPILLPGDAGYADIGSLSGRSVHVFAVAHHGGTAAGKAPAGAGAGGRIALSYGMGNTHNHPLPNSITHLKGQGWSIGSPGAPIDERHTVRRTDRSGVTSIGGAGLGHIRLVWPGGPGTAHNCQCGCTLDPTQ